jgi:hypothetical protein
MTPHRLVLAVAATALPALLGCGGADEAWPPPPAATTTSSTTLARRPTTSTTLEERSDAPILYRPSAWQAGDVMTTEATQKLAENIATLTPDGTVEPQRTTDQVIKTTWVEKCVEVDGEGNRARYLVYFRDWLRTTADTRDESLRGAYISASGRGAERSWSFVGANADTARTAAATKWLDERFGSSAFDDEDLQRILLADRPVTVGSAWTPDVALLVAQLRRNGVVIDRTRVTATAKLEALRDRIADCSFRGAFQLTRLPGVGEMGASWKRGGTFMVEMRMSVPLEGRLRIAKQSERHVALEGDARVQDSTIRIDLQVDETQTNSVGGDFSDPQL